MKTLRQRLTLTHTLVALLAVMIVALLASGLILRAYNQLVQQQTRLARESIRTSLTQYYIRNRGWANIGEVMQERFDQRPALETRRLVLADSDGRVLFDSFDLLTGRRLPARLRLQSVPIEVQGQPVGYLAIPLGGENLSDPERNFIRSVTRMVIVGSAIAGGVAVVVALLISRRVTKPLRSLTLAARRLAAGERHEPLAVPAEAELAELSRAFNSMAADLARQEDLRRQFVADVAHELRTPLSVLRLQVEGLEDGVEPPTPEVFASLREEVNLLTRLVEDLRLLSLADAGQLSLAIEAVDPCAALERAAAAVGPRARRQGIEVRVECTSDLPDMRADPQRLAQVLGNMLENALRYTPRGGQVMLRALPGDVIEARENGGTLPPVSPGSRHQSLVLEVADTGPGIAPEDLPYIFDRFYRTDRARTRETGGSGLGLAIVQRLVEAQGGQVSVTSEPGRGTTFRITLPVTHRVERETPNRQSPSASL